MKFSKSCLFALCFSIASLSFSHNALACAAGCGITNVATSSIIPNDSGGVVFLQYDYMSQNTNWSKNKASNNHNHDKRIETQTITSGIQYMFNRKFGISTTIPYVSRDVKGIEHHHGGNDELTYSKDVKLGDIRVKGIYSGFFDDMSTGVTFGLKLPTGNYKDEDLERNMQIGSGTTDLILGAYHVGKFAKYSDFGYFTQLNFEKALRRKDGYKPGAETSASIGTYYNSQEIGFIKKISPILQITASSKRKDSGWVDTQGNSNSGYSNVYFTPAFEVAIKDFKIYGDVSFPIYRSVNGTQLVPQNLYKMILSYNF